MREQLWAGLNNTGEFTKNPAILAQLITHYTAKGDAFHGYFAIPSS